MAVDHLPKPGETVVGGSVYRAWGGKGANQAVAAARFGASVSMVGAVGDDEWAEPAVEALRAEGVDTGHVTRHSESTGTAVILVDRVGENQIAVAPGANHLADAASLETALAGPRGVLITCFEVLPDQALMAVRLAIARGWRAILNPAPALPLGIEWRELPIIVTPNEAEAAVIGRRGKSADLAAATAWDLIVTRGDRGAEIASDGVVNYVAAPAVDPVDATGAGDTLNGVLAAELASGRPLQEALTTAVHAASISTESRGAREGMPHPDRLRSRFAHQWSPRAPRG